MPRLPLLLLAASLVAGCRSHTTAGLPTVHAARLHPLTETAAHDEPWKPEERYEVIGGPWRVTHGQFDAPAAVLPVSTEAVDPFAAPAPTAPPAMPAVMQPPAPPRTRTLKVPRRRARAEARPVGQKTTRTPEQLAREHFLDYPTRVKARKITLHLPPRYAGEVRLTGQDVADRPGGRRQALGGARLVLRELTLEADRITLRIRDDGLEDVQIMARGNAGFVADVRANVLREEGLRSLLITNDQVVPIR